MYGLRASGLTGECRTKYPEKFARAFCSDELYKNLIKKEAQNCKPKRYGVKH